MRASYIVFVPLQVTPRGPLAPGWQKSALSCNYKLLTVRMAGPDIYPDRYMR